MPFLAAIPALLSAAGVGGTAVATLGTVLPALAGGLQVASGIAQGDPLSAVMGGISGITGGLGGAGAFGSAAGSAPMAGELARQAADVPQAIGSSFGSAAGNLTPSLAADMVGAAPAAASSAVPQVAQDAVQQAAALGAPEAALRGMAPAAGKQMGTLENIAMGIQGAGTAAQGVMSILGALKDKRPNSAPGLGLGRLSMGLPVAGGASSSPLASIPRLDAPGAGTLPQLKLPDLEDNNLLLQLLGAFRT